MNLSAPQLELDGFLLRRTELSDAPAWAEYAALNVVKQHTSSTIECAADLVPVIERCLSTDLSAPMSFTVCMLPARRLVATVGFHSVSAQNRTAEITYDVHPDFWGKGIATACCAAAVSWAFVAREFVRVQATVLEPNVASQRVLQKCGFVIEGKLRNFRLVQGQPRDYLLFAIVPST